MKIFNIHFYFRDHNRVAHVHMSEASDTYTVYFTDVELILEFGNKAKYNQREGVRFIKPGKDAGILGGIITKLLEEDIATVQSESLKAS